ncbi:protein of unknown function (plasmid) [Agrobacterium pusense]|uniref:Uncharacterized protein n=1 Tax=Agrobacterium pusense TaxID=648995 RepID=U4Q4U5_9HYPH|nr:protein of unknown function [Agrobacterium pusense]
MALGENRAEDAPFARPSAKTDYSSVRLLQARLNHIPHFKSMGPDPRAQLAPDGLSQCHPGVSLNSMLRVPHKGISVVAFTFFKALVHGSLKRRISVFDGCALDGRLFAADGFRACAVQHSIEDGAADGDLRPLCRE